MTTEKSTAWFSVETPSVFKEIELPTGDRTPEQKKQFAALVALAAQYGTSIIVSPVQRG